MEHGKSNTRELSEPARIRIVVCISHFHPTVGGAERQLLQLARLWADKGHSVRVITRPIHGLPRLECVGQLEIRRTIRTLSLGPLFGVSFIVSLVLSLLRLTTRSDVILAGQAPWEAVATGLVRRITGKPTAVRLANTGPFGDLRQLDSATGKRALSWCVRSNCSYFAISSHAHDELTQFGCPEESIRPITNGVDTEYFVPSEKADVRRERTVLFVGRLSAQKDPLTLLRSWQQVNQKGEYRLLIVGDGNLASTIAKTIEEQELRNVELLGPRDDLLDVYHQASIFVLPSLSEGCSNALLEAMASGLCPVVSDVGGNRDVVGDEDNGRLVETGNDQQLSEILSELLVSRELRARLSDNARAYVVAHHDIRIVANRYLDEFQSMVD